MWRPAVSRFGAISFVTVMACWTGNNPTTAPSQLEATPRDLTGSYWCAFGEDMDEEPRHPCMIKRVGDKLVLAKLGGDQRLRGTIRPDDREGFTFLGEMYCPFDDCDTGGLHGRFRPVGRGGFKGTFREEAMTLTLMPAPEGAFAGYSYGGATYGGDPFSPTFGGYGYGGVRIRHIDIRHRHQP